MTSMLRTLDAALDTAIAGGNPYTIAKAQKLLDMVKSMTPGPPGPNMVEKFKDYNLT